MSDDIIKITSDDFEKKSEPVSRLKKLLRLGQPLALNRCDCR